MQRQVANIDPLQQIGAATNIYSLYTCLGLTDPLDRTGVTPGHNRWPVFFFVGFFAPHSLPLKYPGAAEATAREW